jgi:hypothetical protein
MVSPYRWRGVYALKSKLNPMLGLGFHIHWSIKIGHLLSMKFVAHGGECAPPLAMPILMSLV